MRTFFFNLTRGHRLALGVCLLACAAFFAGLSGRPGITARLLPDTSVFLREGLLEKISLEVMPLSTLLVPRNFDGEARRDSAAGRFIVGTLLLFLCFDAARRLGGGLKAGALASGAALFFLDGDAEFRLFSLMLLLFVDIAIARSGKEDRLNALAAGLAGAAALFFRSDAAPLLLLYPLYELFASGGSYRERALRAGAMLLPAAVLLAPRLFFSARIIGSPQLFESGSRIEGILVGAGLGSVFAIEGDFRALAGLGAGDNIWAWFLGRIFSEPSVFFAAAPQRFWQAAKLNPLLLAAAAAAFALCKDKRPAALPAAFAAAYLLLHVLLPMEARYFLPLWWLLLPLTGLFAGRWPDKKGYDKYFNPALGALFAAVTGLVFWAAGITARGAVSGLTSGELERGVLAGRVTEPRLVSYALRQAVFREDGPACTALLARAAGLGIPGDSATFFTLNSARAPAEIPGWPGTYLEYGVKVFKELETGGERAAYRTYLKMKQKWDKEKCLAKGAAYGLDLGIAARVSREDTSLIEQYLLKALVFWPEERRAGLARKLERLTGESVPLRLYAAWSSLRRGGRAEAVKDADAAARLAVRKEELLMCASVYAAAGSGEKAGKLLESLAAAGITPGLAAAAVAPAVAAGRHDLAYSFLLRAGARPAESDRNEKCSLLLAASRLPGQRGIFFRTAQLDLAAGRKREAAAITECALRSGLSMEESLQAGIILQDSGEPKKAAEIFGRLYEKYPEQKEFLYYTGVARILAGDYSGAVPVIEKYIRISGGGDKAVAALSFVKKRQGGKK